LKKEIMGYTEKQALSRKMVETVNDLLDYINSDEELFCYLDLLELFKQCKTEITSIFKETVYDSDTKKFSAICNYIRDYYDDIFGMGATKKCITEYFDKSVSTFVPCNVSLHPEVHEAFQAKMKTMKEKENKENYRAFTMIGAVNTCVMAVAKGMIDFRKIDGQIYLMAKDGIVGTAAECKLFGKEKSAC
jgi:hypothetical protein